ncbi:carboxypeptidase-like regulatory domain-containing protein [Winogradskyella vincentii]|uniref:Carboxypeptidase-like regulatory domain-containing protein n=1 Tax=Winogradskyella vincentii TaxID=2877122 RepID=A0ABS7XVY9_9FLAO|nr:carboxypeptidase-like regulatory domain-containing protein [Winogradskyella vincentii]MCA0151810.1 carboxypeptidase-like regulatory domain-containing protein [Winogradskyella vincentii]
MIRIKFGFTFYFILYSLIVFGQRKDLKGQLIANGDVEGIHILNKTAPKYTVSEEDGSFIIPAKVSDTLFISGLKYESKEIVITNTIIISGILRIALVEKINELDEVIVGKILTGSLESDLQNSDAKTEVNFYDLGIPGYIGKPLTINERKLHDADAGPWGHIGLGFGVNFHKLLNRISGRTKKLKKIVDLDSRDKCIERLKREYESIIFENEYLAENLTTEFFLFCQEDEGFLELCNRNNDIEAIEFLKLKLKAYNNNRKSSSND